MNGVIWSVFSKWRFVIKEQVKSLDLASHLSINMLHHYEVEDLVFSDYRMDGLDIPETIELRGSRWCLKYAACNETAQSVKTVVN